MPFQIKCPNPACGKPLTVREEHAGKGGRCPACKVTFTVPAAPGAQVPRSGPSLSPRPPAVSGNEAGLQPLEEERNAPRRERIIDKRPTPPPRPGDSSAARRRQEPAPEPVQDYEVVDEDEVTGPPSRAGRPAGPRSGARSAPQDDYEVVDEEDHRPRRKSRRRDDDYEEEDDFDDDYDDEPRRRPRRRRARRLDRPRWRGPARKFDTELAVTVGIGIFLLIFLALTPLFSYVSTSASASVGGFGVSRSSSSGSGMDSPEGKWILGVSLAVAVLVGIAFALSFAIEPYVADGLIAGVGSLAAGWGLTVILWVAAMVWKVFRESSAIKELAGKVAAGMIKAEVSIYPGVGLWLGLAAALIVCGLFCFLASTRDRGIWLGLGLGVGLLVGILLFVFDVKPWHSEFEEAMKGNPFLR